MMAQPDFRMPPQLMQENVQVMPQAAPEQQFQMPAGFPMMPPPPMAAAPQSPPPLPPDISAAPMDFEMATGGGLGGLGDLRRRFQLK